MDVKNIHRHCPEVEKLMNSKMPFVTRFGVILVAMAVLCAFLITLLTDGALQKLVKEMIAYTIEHIASKM